MESVLCVELEMMYWFVLVGPLLLIESIILPSNGSWRNKGAVTIYQGKVYFSACAKFYIAEPNSFKALKKSFLFF